MLFLFGTDLQPLLRIIVSPVCIAFGGGYVGRVNRLPAKVFHSEILPADRIVDRVFTAVAEMTVHSVPLFTIL